MTLQQVGVSPALFQGWEERVGKPEVVFLFVGIFVLFIEKVCVLQTALSLCENIHLIFFLIEHAWEVFML